MSEYPATASNGQCIFCEIVAGRLPACSFWETEEFLAFLAIDPNTEGFSCVIPKAHYGSDVLKMSDDVLQRFVLAAKTVAGILERYFADVGRVGLLMEGSGIDHAHVKLAPMHGTEHFKRGEWRQMHSHTEQWFDKYEGWISSAGGPLADKKKLAELSQKLKASQQ